MKSYIMGAIKKLVETYKTKEALEAVVNNLERSIKSSFTTSKVLDNDLWKYYREKFIDLAKKDVDDFEMAGVVCGFEGFIAGFLMGEGFNSNDIKNELGGEKWKQ